MKANDSKTSGGLKTLLTAMMVIGSMWALQGCSGSPLEPTTQDQLEQPGLQEDGAGRTELPAIENPGQIQPGDEIDKGRNPAKAD